MAISDLSERLVFALPRSVYTQSLSKNLILLKDFERNSSSACLDCAHLQGSSNDPYGDEQATFEQPWLICELFDTNKLNCFSSIIAMDMVKYLQVR